MTYTHLSTDELVIIEPYFHQKTPVSMISKWIDCPQCCDLSSEPARAHWTTTGATRRTSKCCGRKRTELPADQRAYVTEKVAQGWTPDVIVGRRDRHISCSGRALYHMFKRNTFDISTLPMKGKRKSNGHK